MISDEMIRELTIGTVIKSDVPKKKRDYISYKDRNGKVDQMLGFRNLDETVSWFFVGVELEGDKKFLKCVEKDPILSLEFRGASACFYGEKELSNIARHWFANKGIKYARSINVDDVNALLGIGIRPSSRLYTFKNGDYSPESFIKHRHAPKGRRVRHSAYSYSEAEIHSTSVTDIVFIDKPYWLANKSISVREDCAYFGLGEVTKDGVVKMEHNLFKSNGEILGGSNTAYVRSVVYIEPEFFSLTRLDDGAFRLLAS